MAHRIGTGEPCLPMEEQRGWSPGQEDPSCLQWDSSRSRRNRLYWPSAPANQRTEGGIWPRGPMKPPIGHNTPPTDGWVLSAEQIKRVWDAQQGGSRNIRWEIETHGIEWMSVACGRQA